MKNAGVKKITLFYRDHNANAVAYSKKIKRWLADSHPEIKLVEKSPELVIALGGDGSVLEAARVFRKSSPVILGLNFGNVGFLASVRQPKRFIPSINKVIKGECRVVDRMMITTSVFRKNKKIFETDSLNEVVVQSVLGVVKVRVDIEKHPLQFLRGTGILVSTATGSTAYNLSAHGPILTPDIECMVVTEILDHNIPTPSVVIGGDKDVTLTIMDFREKGLLSVSKTGKAVDVLLAADGQTILPLRKGDRVSVRRSKHTVKLAELEKNYFFKSLEEKLGFS